MKALILVVFLALSSISLNLVNGQGYHKDIFIDAGCHLSQRTKLWAADSLGLSYENMTTKDSIVQHNKIAGNSQDLNGLLLYPDGSPRYRMIYTNGGKATAHGRTLGLEGIKHIRQFYNNGGSYMGSCAGAFIASKSHSSNTIPKEYYGLFPGRTKLTTLYDKKTGHHITPNSALLKYETFGNDMHIDSIYHWGGCYLRDNFQEGAEILLTFDYPEIPELDNQISCWSHKASEKSGRLVVIGSHPEHETTGDGLKLAKAMIQYALSDQEHLSFKGELKKGETIEMDKTSDDNQPLRTMIGDQQFHHFTINVPEGTDNLNISLVAPGRFKFVIYADKQPISVPESAKFKSLESASKASLAISNPPAGKIHIAVQCTTKVYMTREGKDMKYTGNVDLLNGTPYSITTNW